MGGVGDLLRLLQLCLLLGLYLLDVRDTGPEGVLPRYYDLQMMQDGVETSGGSWTRMGLALCRSIRIGLAVFYHAKVVISR